MYPHSFDPPWGHIRVQLGVGQGGKWWNSLVVVEGVDSSGERLESDDRRDDSGGGGGVPKQTLTVMYSFVDK
jgi:hypothetical protein